MAPRVEPAFPTDATLPRPTNDTARTGMAAFLNWTHDVQAWGRELAVRATKTTQAPACR